MICKLLEVRDRMTFVPVMAVRLEPACEADRHLLARAGYGTRPESQREYILYVKINGGSGASSCDPFDWGDRTHATAHRFIAENFDTLASGDVVDVRFILGETDAPAAPDGAE